MSLHLGTMQKAWRSLYPRISADTARIGLLLMRRSQHQLPDLIHSPVIGNLERRLFSSAPVINLGLVSEIFSKPIESNEIQADLESLNVFMDRNTAYLTLQNFESSLETARRFFKWASDTGTHILTSNSYNLMLRIVATKGEPEEIWDLIKTMKKKGFGISKETYSKVHENLENDVGKGDDFIVRLKKTYLRTNQSMIHKVCKKLKATEDPEEMRRSLLDLDICLSSEFVDSVLKSVGSNPQKALVFLEWVMDIKSLKMNSNVYITIAKVFYREDCLKEFWHVLHKMRNAGYEMENDAYRRLLVFFHKRKNIAAAVDLYEFVMAGSTKPPAPDFGFLLNLIAMSEEDLDMTLISRAVSIFINSGNIIESSIFNGLLKSLKKVGRRGEFGNILNVMVDGAVAADSSLQDLLEAELCSDQRLDTTSEHVKNLKNPPSLVLSVQAWATLVNNHANAYEFDDAFFCFKGMVMTMDCERKGGYVFEVLVSRLCEKDRHMDAFKILKKMVMEKKYRPLCSTFKFLIKNLVNQGCLKEATSLVELMRGNGFPPFVKPFIDHMSKSGSAEDAMGYLKAMTSKQFPSLSVFIRLFKTLLKAGRHEVAQDVLYKSPGCVRNHEDVLEIFFSMQPNEKVLS